MSPSEPRVLGGQYWGYNVRLAKSLGAVFTECPYKGTYDMRIGTSERGTPIDDMSTCSFRYNNSGTDKTQGLVQFQFYIMPYPPLISV